MKNNVVLLNTVRKVQPTLIADELVGVQPMASEASGIWKLKPTSRRLFPRFGEIWHNFVYGYQICDGKEMISFEKFVEKFPDLNIEELMILKGTPRYIKWFMDIKNSLP